MCDFCKRGNIGNELCNEIGYKPITLGAASNVAFIDAYIMQNNDDTLLQIDVAMTYSRDNIAVLDIPIQYCPKCGKKLTD